MIILNLGLLSLTSPFYSFHRKMSGGLLETGRLKNSRPSPGIETCFMSIDEIARICCKFQSLYRGGEFGIFHKSQVLGRSSEFFKVPDP